MARNLYSHGGIDSTALYFGLLSGATLGGNITPIGASANITAIGILRKEGHTVLVQAGAGAGAGFPDEAYAKQGAEIVATADEMWARCDFLAKVKEIAIVRETDSPLISSNG